MHMAIVYRCAVKNEVFCAKLPTEVTMKRTILTAGRRFEDALVNTMMDTCDDTEHKEVTPEITAVALETARLRREDETGAEYQASLTKLKKLL